MQDRATATDRRRGAIDQRAHRHTAAEMQLRRVRSGNCDAEIERPDGDQRDRHHLTLLCALQRLRQQLDALLLRR